MHMNSAPLVFLFHSIPDGSIKKLQGSGQSIQNPFGSSQVRQHFLQLLVKLYLTLIWMARISPLYLAAIPGFEIWTCIAKRPQEKYQASVHPPSMSTVPSWYPFMHCQLFPNFCLLCLEHLCVWEHTCYIIGKGKGTRFVPLKVHPCQASLNVLHPPSTEGFCMVRILLLLFFF